MCMKPRVRLLDDDDIFLQEMSHFLEEQGLEIACASSNIEGLLTVVTVQTIFVLHTQFSEIAAGNIFRSTAEAHHSTIAIPMAGFAPDIARLARTLTEAEKPKGLARPAA